MTAPPLLPHPPEPNAPRVSTLRPDENRDEECIMADEIDLKTQETAKRLFGGGIKMDPPYRIWKAFDRELANDFSRFITGNLYSRTVLTPPGKADGRLRGPCRDTLR
jgi:hypothetical protein